MHISVNHAMERRIGIFPAGFDRDGLLFCNQSFADYPVIIPDGRFAPNDIKPKYMLLSYRKAVAASSELKNHPARLAANEDICTWWCARGGSGEWLQMDLGKSYTPHSIQLNFAEEKIKPLKMPKEECSGDFATGYRYTDSGNELRTRYVVEGSLDGESWFSVFDGSKLENDRSHPYLILNETYTLRYIRVTALELPYGSRFALSGLRVFGLDNGMKPAELRKAQVHFEDAMTCRLWWDKQENALGYNIRYGIAPDKLYSSHLVYEENTVLLTALNAGQEYFFAIDSFNESGVTEGQIQAMSCFSSVG